MGVDLDPAMAQIAQQFFGLVPDHRLKVDICDGLDFVKNAADQGEAREGYETIYVLSILSNE